MTDLFHVKVCRFFEDIPVVAPLLSAKAQGLTDACELGQMVEIDLSKLH